LREKNLRTAAVRTLNQFDSNTQPAATTYAQAATLVGPRTTTACPGAPFDFTNNAYYVQINIRLTPSSTFLNAAQALFASAAINNKFPCF